MKQKYGWIPDVPDARDLYATVAAPRDLPKSVDLRPMCPPVYNQGALGSCTAQAVGAILQFTEQEVTRKGSTPSRLFLYYNARVLQGTVDHDSGASIRNAVKAVNRAGFCHEPLWPYRISDYGKKPAKGVYSEAKKHLLQPAQYARVPQTLEAIQAALADHNPIVFGFAVYESFESADVRVTGNVPMPGRDEKMLGGHAVVLVGYNDRTNYFIVRNSWGAQWGIGGYCRMPYEFVLHPEISADFWQISMVTA